MGPVSGRGAALALAVLVLVAGCRRREEGVFVTAPFNEHTRLARIDVAWEISGDTLGFDVRAENRLSDRLYLRLGGLRLLDERGEVVGSSQEFRGCILAAGATDSVLRGVLPRPAADVEGFEIERFGVPLSDRGRAIYREFLLQSGSGAPAEVDAEIAGYAGAPPCG